MVGWCRRWYGRWSRRWRQATAAQRQTLRLVALSAAAGVVLSAVTVGAAGPWDSGQRAAERARAASAGESGGGAGGDYAPEPAPTAPPVLTALGVPAGGGPDFGDSGEGAVPLPTDGGLTGALEPLLKDPAIGPVVSATVLDADSGRQVFGYHANTPAVPASVIKLATGAAVLSSRGPDYRIPTTVVGVGSTSTSASKSTSTSKSNSKGKAGPKSGNGTGGTYRIVLVGGGDPTLTAHPVSGAEHPASLRTLADETATALKKRGTGTVRLDYDTSLYSGPLIHPIGINDNIAPVTSLMTDEGRLDDSDHGPAPRAADPAAAAARTFAGLLHARGIDVTGQPREAKAPKGADALATVRSEPLSALIERMLTNSDNDIAEAMARQAALATGQPASFQGGADAVLGRLRKLHVPLTGVHLTDGSGLNRADHVPSSLLAQVLVRAAAPDHPELRPLITGLPVAGFTGTLRERYAQDPVGRGVVRAKTGTLTGVNTLAGTVVDADGRLLVYAFMTNGTTDAPGAEAALDRVASALANCGCR
jgi:serine-type D-Ala-D-Ala carboxypeptidase/endopeptidase (penicillin-binding protein 4)